MICYYLFVIFFIAIINKNQYSQLVNADPQICSGHRGSVHCKNRLNHWIEHYEPLNYDSQSIHARAKRSLLPELSAAQTSLSKKISGSSSTKADNQPSESSIDGRSLPTRTSHFTFDHRTNEQDKLRRSFVPIRIEFDSHGHRFILHLKPDPYSVFAKDVIIEGPDGQPFDPHSEELDLNRVLMVHDHDYVPSLHEHSYQHYLNSDERMRYETVTATASSNILESVNGTHHTISNIDQGRSNQTSYQFYFKPRASAASSSSSSVTQSRSKSQPILLEIDHVHGSLKDGVFEGRIWSKDGRVFYVERAGKYLDDLKRFNESYRNIDDPQDLGFHSIIYEGDHVNAKPSPLKSDGSAHSHSDDEDRVGAGCAHDDIHVKDWMSSVSNAPSELVPDKNNNTDDSSASSASNQKKSRTKRKAQSPWDNPWNPLDFSFGQLPRIANNRDIPPNPPTTNHGFPSPDIGPIRRRACSLYIQTDTFLWEHIKKHESNDAKAREEIASLVAQHIKAVNHIYENTDFNGIRGLKFIVQRLKINDSSACDLKSTNRRDGNPFCSPNIDVSNFLNLNSQFNHNDFCLAYIFTYRDFSGGTLGLAWVASTSGASGGICEKYKTYSENIGGRQVQTKRSLNTGIITFVNYNSRVPPKVSELTLAHEIGHNFGSPHDYPLECRPGGSAGNFIMYSSATSGERANNNKFSPCSVRNISAVLHSIFSGDGGKDNCFHEDDGPFCGNKIVEEGEECDCGYDMKECTEQCCYPKEVDPFLATEPWAKPCRRRPQAKCSPSEGPCCNEQCSFETPKKLCRSESECQHRAFCTGGNATCPHPSPKPDKTECNGGTQVCWQGQCVGSICQKYDFEECFLTAKSGAKPDEMCEVACQVIDKPDSCRSTSGIDHMRNISGLKLRPGSPCNDFQGYCDVFQRCRAVDAEGPLARLKNLLFNQRTLSSIKMWVTNYWWACTLLALGVMIFMAAFIKCCAVHTPSSNPKKRPHLRLTDTLKRPADTLRNRRRSTSGGRSHGRSGSRHAESSGGGRHRSGGSHHQSSSTSGPSSSNCQHHHHHRGQCHNQSHSSSSNAQASSSTSSSQPSAPSQALILLNSPPNEQNNSQLHQQHFQMTSSVAPLLPVPHLIVALPPESGTATNSSNNTATTFIEPPPPYPGLGPTLNQNGQPQPPAAPPVASSLSLSGTNIRPTAPPLPPGPSHGYGKNRGIYNQKQQQQTNAPQGKSSASGQQPNGKNAKKNSKSSKR